jgi:hypothetical protein
MVRKKLVALAGAAMLCTAFVSTEASARYGGWYGSGYPYGVSYGNPESPYGIWYGNYGYPYVPCKVYYYSGTYTYAGWFPYAGCDPLKSD